MNKRERLEEITRLVNKKGTVRISEIVELLNVTDINNNIGIICINTFIIYKNIVENTTVPLPSAYTIFAYPSTSSTSPSVDI